MRREEKIDLPLIEKEDRIDSGPTIHKPCAVSKALLKRLNKRGMLRGSGPRGRPGAHLKPAKFMSIRKRKAKLQKQARRINRRKPR